MMHETFRVDLLPYLELIQHYKKLLITFHNCYRVV